MLLLQWAVLEIKQYTWYFLLPDASIPSGGCDVDAEGGRNWRTIPEMTRASNCYGYVRHVLLYDVNSAHNRARYV